MANRYRKIPVEIEAIQYTKATRDACIRFCNARHKAIDDEGAEYDLENLRIHTLEGVMMCKPGDWIIRGVKGEFYPCKPDIFAATYEAVE